MIKTLKLSILFLLVLAVGCKSAKRVGSNGELDGNLSSKQLIKLHEKQDLNFKTLQSKVKVEYVKGDQEQSHTINLRMEKDKVIWLSSAFAYVRAKITPEKVRFYNKLDNTFFDGDFALISELLGTELNFNNIQNMLLGEALFELDEKKYNAETFENSYVLSPKNQNALYEIFFLMNPSHYKMDSQQLSQPVDRRMLQIDYKNYQEVDKQTLPENIKIIAVENREQTIISMQYKSVSLNNDLRFPFRIPSGFDEIEL